MRKMADVAFFLGVIDQEQRSDLKTLATPPDRYAHHRHAKQLYDEPDYFALITKTNLYKNNQLQLVGLNEQAVLMCIKA
ncbi:MAG: hypothetical protein E8D41_13085 [Nitrospira sp.]|nr:MAG: hypothetical protein E8D41_13085 [Nitrospira sp.]